MSGNSTSVSSGVITGVTTLFNGRHTLNTVQVFGDGVNAATVNVYDNTTNSGKIVCKLLLAAATAGVLERNIAFSSSVRLETALTVEVIGTGASAIVSFGA